MAVHFIPFGFTSVCRIIYPLVTIFITHPDIHQEIGRRIIFRVNKSGIDGVPGIILVFRLLVTDYSNVSIGNMVIAHKAGSLVNILYLRIDVFFIRQGKLLGRDHFHMKVAEGDSKSDIISEFMKQYYGGTPFIPNIIMVQYEIEDADTIAQWLSARKSRKVSIVTPKKGDKEKMVELAYKNAQLVLTQDAEKIKREESRTTGAMKEIAGWLGLGTLHRAEAYDISNTNGVESVGSMVVFEDGKPKKNDYRKFRIRTVKGPDDYKSMREVLTRRFTRGMREREGLEDSHGFSRYPDLIMMDGGRGQVNIALDVLKELGLNIPVCGMVKDDTHSTRGLYYNNIEIPIDKHSEGFKLITRVQDEAHRFAITYHRSLRGKAQVSSVLDSIEGIGPVRRKALMKHFLDIEKIRQASVDELMKADGITENVAENIYKFFH